MSEPLRAARSGWFANLPADALQALGDGHINDTFLVTVTGADAGVSGRYVLQRLSSSVFTDPQLVMDNVVRVLTHFAGADVRLPELIPAVTNQPMWRDSRGGVWRLWRFRDNTRTLSSPISPAEAEQAGWAFGRFQSLLADLPEPPLAPVIPGFLDLRHYLAAFDVALDRVRSNPAAAAIPGEAQFIADERTGFAATLLPQRDYIHGDCKVNNLLFGVGNDRVDCVLDLDTVMLGHWAWDFGDLARSLATSEGNLSLSLFAAAARGFVRGKGLLEAQLDQRQRADIVDSLLVAPGYVTFMLAVRFVTDHLTGDRYFKVQRRGENLERAQVQIALYRAFAQHDGQMRKLLVEMFG